MSETRESIERDRLWCTALTQTLDPADIERVTSAFNALRKERAGQEGVLQEPCECGHSKYVHHHLLHEDRFAYCLADCQCLEYKAAGGGQPE